MKQPNNPRVEELYAKTREELETIYFDTTGLDPKKSMSKIAICRKIDQTEFLRRRFTAKIPFIKEIF